MCAKQGWIKWLLRERKEEEKERDLATCYNQGKKQQKKASYKLMEMKDGRTWMSRDQRQGHSRMRVGYWGPHPGNVLPSYLVQIWGFYRAEEIQVESSRYQIIQCHRNDKLYGYLEQISSNSYNKTINTD